MKCSQHFDGIVPSVVSIVTKQHSIHGKMSLDASALKNLCLWCEFQSHLLFIISLLLENFLTALPACLIPGRRGLCPQGSLPFASPKSTVYYGGVTQYFFRHSSHLWSSYK